MARKKTRKRTRSPRSSKSKPPKTARQYYALPPRQQEIWDSLAHVIASVRRGVPLRRASKEFGISLSTLLALGRPTLRKKNGRYVATKTDQLLRVLPILKRKG